MPIKTPSLFNFCPQCGSPNTVYKKKAQEWECNDCEDRFNLEPYIEHHVLKGKAKKPRNIFFSYGHDEHTELVEKFKNDLELRGHTVWFDKNRIGTWDDWREKITHGIHNSQMVIAYMSKHALRDPGVCRNEIAIALSRFGVVYPIKLEKNIDDDIPVTIRNLQWPDLSLWQKIKAGKIAGEDWNRWYESRLIELIEKIENDASTFSWEAETLRAVLRPVSFESQFDRYLEKFVGRDWLFDAYYDWVNNKPESRLFWLRALPGFGKTAFATNLAYRERATVVSSWFCDWRSDELQDPKAAIRTLAFQLAVHYDNRQEQPNSNRWSDYRCQLLSKLGVKPGTTEAELKKITDELNEKKPYDLFRTLLKEPLANLIWREHKLVILIDALDEANNTENYNQLTELLTTCLDNLPKWVSFIVTSRPELPINEGLQGYKPFEICGQDTRNIQDIRAWYIANLAKNNKLVALPKQQQQEIQEQLIKRSEGMFLFLIYIEEGLRENSLTVSDLKNLCSGVPGINALYSNRFRSIFGQNYSKATHVRELIRLLLTAPGSLPEKLACEALNWTEEQLNDAKLMLGSYVISSSGSLNLFHKSIAEWLMQKKDNSFWVDTTPSRQKLADILFGDLEKNQDYRKWHDIAIEWIHQWRNKPLTQWSDPDLINIIVEELLNNDYFEMFEIEPYCIKALELLKIKHPKNNHPSIAKTLCNLASIVSWTEYDMGLYNPLDLYNEALTVLNNAYPNGLHLDMVETLYYKALFELQNAYDIKSKIQFVPRKIKENKSNDPKIILDNALSEGDLIHNRELYKYSSETLKRAISNFEKALELIKELYPRGIHPVTADILEGLAKSWSALEPSKNKVIHFYEQSLSIQDELYTDGIHSKINSTILKITTQLEPASYSNVIIKYYERSLLISEALLTNNEIITAIKRLAIFLLAHKPERILDSINYLKRALLLKIEGHLNTARYNNAHEEDDLFNDLYFMLNNLGDSLFAIGDPTSLNKAIKCYELAFIVSNEIYYSYTKHSDIPNLIFKLGLTWFLSNNPDKKCIASYYWSQSIKYCKVHTNTELEIKLQKDILAISKDFKLDNKKTTEIKEKHSLLDVNVVLDADASADTKPEDIKINEVQNSHSVDITTDWWDDFDLPPSFWKDSSHEHKDKINSLVDEIAVLIHSI